MRSILFSLTMPYCNYTIWEFTEPHERMCEYCGGGQKNVTGITETIEIARIMHCIQLAIMRTV